MPKIYLDTAINPDRFVFKYSRSAGPGGQNINKVSTRVTLFFDITNCQELSETQKKRITKKLATRINKNGVIRVISQKHRTQNANKRAAIERLNKLINDALKKKVRRKKTTIPKRKKEKSAELLDTEENLRTIFGTKVIIKQKGRNGTIEIHWYSLDDLERLIEIINKRI